MKRVGWQTANLKRADSGSESQEIPVRILPFILLIFPSKLTQESACYCFLGVKMFVFILPHCLDEIHSTNQKYDLGGIKIGIWGIGPQINASPGKYAWHFECQIDRGQHPLLP